MIFIGAPMPPPRGTPLHWEGAAVTTTLVVMVIALIILGVAIERTLNWYHERKRHRRWTYGPEIERIP